MYHMDVELSSGPFVAHGPAGSNPCFQTGGTVIQLIQKERTCPPDQLWRHYSRIAFLLCLSATCFVTCYLLFCPSALHQPLLKMMAYFSVHLFYGRRRQWWGIARIPQGRTVFPCKCPGVKEWQVNPVSWAATTGQTPQACMHWDINK